MCNIKIETKNLVLLACNLNLANAELESKEHLKKHINAEIPDEWPPGEYDRGAQEFFRDKLLEGGNEVIGWYSWYVIKKPEKQDEKPELAGAGGFMGPPDVIGAVEIGFSVVDKYHRKGLGSEIVKALIDYAFSFPYVSIVFARTNPDNHASRRVLEKCGFLQVGSKENNLLTYKINKLKP